MNIFLRHVWKNALVCWSMISLTFKFQRWLSIYYVKIQKQLTLSMCDYISVLVISIFLGVKMIRSSRPKLFLKKDVLKISSKFTGEHPCQSAILIKLQSSFIESNFDLGVLLYVCCIFSEQFFLKHFWRAASLFIEVFHFFNLIFF